MVLKNTCCLYLAVATLLCVALVAESGVIKKAKNARCSDWQKTACQPKKGNCGSGFQHGTRTGDCKGTTERRFKCTVPCTAETTAVDMHNGGAPPSLEELESEVVGQSRRPAIRPGRGRPNGKKSNKKQKGKKGGKKGKNGKRKACRYTRGTLSTCDPQLKLVTQTMTLRKGDSNECERNKTITRPCEGCKYGKTELTTRGDCDEQTNTQTLTLTLTSGDPQNCAKTWTVSRKCKKNMGAKDGRKKRAKQEKRQQRKQEKKEKKKQKKEKRKEKKNKKQNRKQNKKCQYTKGDWSECDSNSEKRRIDTLETTSQPDCEQTKTLIKKCRVPDASKCRYGERVASECVNGSVTITSSLVSGPDTCAQTKTTEKTCGKCIFDKWGDFGPCQNGVKTKKRDVLQGGEKCQRKAVKMRKCKG